jgi:chlorophyll synthase
MNGWWGNAAVGISYEGISWFTGAAVMLGASYTLKRNEHVRVDLIYARV